VARGGPIGLLLGVLPLACACSVYDPELAARARVDAGPRCELRRPAPRPTAPDDGVDAGEVVWALKDVVLNQDGDRWRTIGYDLDGLCSHPPDPPVECLPPARTADPETDGEGGIDNAFGHQLYPLIALTLPELENDAHLSEAMGVGAILVRLRGWNGQPDDSRVEATLMIGVTGTAGGADGAPPDVTVVGNTIQAPDGSAPPPPAWDGHDYFWVRDDGFLDGDPARPRLQDDNAYVAGDLLVATLPTRVDILFQATEQAVLVRLTDSIAVGRIVDEGARFDAVVAGRWALFDIFETAERVGICQGTTQYRLLSDQLDRIADIRATAGTGGEGVACDAMSVGAAFTGYRGHVGGLLPAGDVPNACAAAADGGVPDAGPIDAASPDAG